MAYASTNDLIFLSTVRQWIEANGEVLVMIRFHAAAGARSYEFFRAAHDFAKRLHDLPPRACLTVFRDCQLPLRGIVNEDFIQEAVKLVADGAEFLIVALERTTIGKGSWFHDAAGETHVELIEALRSSYCYAKPMACGPFPPWLEDNDAVISAVVPNKDGSVTTGAY